MHGQRSTGLWHACRTVDLPCARSKGVMCENIMSANTIWTDLTIIWILSGQFFGYYLESCVLLVGYHVELHVAPWQRYWDSTVGQS